MRKMIMFLSISLGLMSVQVAVSYACSGGRDYHISIEDMLPSVNIIVRGEIVEHNTGNAVLEVEYYLQGSGERYLLLYEKSPALYQSHNIRRYNYDCIVGKTNITKPGIHGYFMLIANPNGTYSLGELHDDALFSILSSEFGQTISYRSKIDDSSISNYEYLTVPIEEFEELIKDWSQQEPIEPETNQTYTRFRPLYIHTESGDQYMIPVDSPQLVSLDSDREFCQERCVITSSDRSHILYPVPTEDNVYVLWYPDYFPVDDWYNGWETDYYHVRPPRITAYSLMFAPNSNYILAWNDTELSIYYIEAFDNPTLTGKEPSLSLLWRTTLQTDEIFTSKVLAGQGAWNANNNTIVYWDAEGLKWLDLTTLIAPKTLYEHEESLSVLQIPPVLELSTTGRYVRYGTQSEWKLFDTVSGMVFDDLLVSPTEKRFIHIEPEEWSRQTVINFMTENGTCDDFTESNDCIISSVGAGGGCLALITCPSNVRLAEDFIVQEIYWLSDDRFAVIVCDVETQTLCTSTNSYNSNPPRIEDAVKSNDFVFDSIYEVLAWAFDDYMLTFGFGPGSRYDIDLSDQLDSPIVGLEWGNPLWYVEP